MKMDSLSKTEKTTRPIYFDYTNISIGTNGLFPTPTEDSIIDDAARAHFFAVWEDEMVPVVILFAIISITGMLLNSISFAYFRAQSGLGNIFQTLLSAADFASCLYFVICLLVGILYEKPEFCRTVGWEVAGYQLANLILNVSALVTVYLSVIRTVLVLSPFRRISKRAVYVSFSALTSALSITALVGGVWLNTPLTNYHLCNPDDSPIHPATQPAATLLDTAPVCLMMLAMLLSSVLTVRALRKPGQLTDHRGAATTACVLCAAFLLCSGSMVIAEIVQTALYHHEDEVTAADYYALRGQLSILSLANSLANPVIFIARNKLLVKWLRSKCGLVGNEAATLSSHIKLNE